MGTTNLLTARSVAEGARIKVGETEFAVPRLAASEGTTVSFSLRPEALRPLVGRRGGAGRMGRGARARLTRLEFLGALTRIEASLSHGAPLRAASLDHPLHRLKPGDPLRFAYDPGRIMVFA